MMKLNHKVLRQKIKEKIEEAETYIAQIINTKIDKTSLKYWTGYLHANKQVLALLDDFVPKLEALLTDHVSRSKLIQTFPELKQGTLMTSFVLRVLEWKEKRLELLTKNGEEK